MLVEQACKGNSHQAKARRPLRLEGDWEAIQEADGLVAGTNGQGQK
jgi:hypothetical protein